MSEADKTYGKCPVCKSDKFLTGRWAQYNPKLKSGKKACVDCFVGELLQVG